MGYRSEQELLEDVLAWDPRNEEVRRQLLASLLQWFNHCQHEWPMGILYWMDGATLEECDAILERVSYARTLDAEGAHAEYLVQFEGRVREYQERLRALSPDAT